MRWRQRIGGRRCTSEDSQVCRKQPCAVRWGNFLLQTLSVYRIWRTTESMQEVVLTFSQQMRNAVAVGSDYGGLHSGWSRWDWYYQPKRWTSEKGAAAVVAAEERPRILEWLRPARRVTKGGCWTGGVWLIPGRTAWSADPRFPFAIIPNPNPKSEIEANAQTLKLVIYLLLMEVVSPCDTRTMWTYAAKKWQTLAQHLSQHPSGIREGKGFSLEECRKSVRSNDRVTRPWGTTQIAWIYEIPERASETKSWER